MHRRPPEDDEREDYAPDSYPRQRRSSSGSGRRQSPDRPADYIDEQEQLPIPKRRASLNLSYDERTRSGPTTSSSISKQTRNRPRRPATPPEPEFEPEPEIELEPEMESEPDDDDMPVPRPPTTRTRTTATRRPAAAQAQASRRPSAAPAQPSRRPTSPQASRRPPTAPAARSSRPLLRPVPGGQPRTFIGRLHDLSHNKPLLILCALALVFVITLIPALINGLANRSVGLANQPSSSSSLSGQTSQNPHQIVIVPSDTDHPAPPVYATSAYLLDASSGATLYAHNPFMHLPMLSTTKLMTALLAVEHGNLDQKITITPALNRDIQNHLSADSSLFGIKQGETYTLRDLFYGLLLPSGNDAAIAIADTIGGSYQHFVDMMNQRARQLGMYDTHYMNPHGLLMDNHYSCAHDLAIIGRVTMNNAVLQQIAATRIYHIPKGGNHPERYLVNGNQFLWWYPGADGGKPGWDGGSNFVQVVSVTRNHHRLIGVTMHTNDWWTDMRDLMNWGFNDFHWISPYDVDFQHPIPYDTDWNYFSKDKKENTIPTADKGRYYIYTGYAVSAPILGYFDQAGGLKKLGYPTGMPDYTQTPLVSQHFEKGTIQCDLTSKQCKTA